MISHHKLILNKHILFGNSTFYFRNPTLNLACIFNEKLIIHELIISDISNIEFELKHMKNI
jgi:hypothetical protein